MKMELLSFTTFLIHLIHMAILVSSMNPKATQQPGLAYPPLIQGTQLHYAQNPFQFVKEKGNEKQQGYPPSNVQTRKGENTFVGALPYDQLPQHQTVGRTHGISQQERSKPAVLLYNQFQNQPQRNNQIVRNIPIHETNPKNPQSDNNLNPYGRPVSRSKQPLFNQPRPTKSPSLQAKLSFDLFNSRGFDQKPPYTQPDFFVGNSQRQLYQPSSQNNFIPLGNFRNQFRNDNAGFGDYGNFLNPTLSQGFSVPTTYQGNKDSGIVSNEAFSSVTDPSMDKKSIISSYVPANNFVNPTNFFIPSEDKHNMINQIFGGFQKPNVQPQKLPTNVPKNVNGLPAPTYAPNAGSYNPYNTNNKIVPSYSDSRQHTGNVIKGVNLPSQIPTGYTGGKGVVIGHQVKTQALPISSPVSKSSFVTGDLGGHQNNDEFSNSYVHSPTTANHRGNGLFNSKQEKPALLFSEFSYDTPFSLNEFRSKNLLGGKNFGITDYDRKRLSSDIVADNADNFNVREVYPPNNAIRQQRPTAGIVSGPNGHGQIDGVVATNGGSFDNSYHANRGYDKTIDDNINKSTRKESFPDSRQVASKSYSSSDSYDNAGDFADGDDYRNSYTYSDGGGDSSYTSTDDNNSDGFKKSYKNVEDTSDSDSYDNADGYKRTYYDGKNYDVSDGYTDNVKYNNNDLDSNQKPFDTEDGFRQGVAKVASALAAGKAVEPYRGLGKSVSEGLPSEANYKPFDVNDHVHN